MFRISYFYLILILFQSGCAKEHSYEGGPPSTNGSPGDPVVYKSEWQFKEADALYLGPVDTAFLTKEPGRQILTISGKTVTGNERITMVISSIGTVTKGVYATSRMEVKFFYYNAADTMYIAQPYLGGDIIVTITERDDLHIAGTFRGTVLDKSKASKSIVNGRFSSPLRKAGAASATGSVLLWASESCNGAFKVKVNDLPGEVSSFPYITPECGEAGSASFNLKPGSYRWVAYCAKDSISGTVKVSADSCSKIKIEFPFKPAAVTYTKDSCKIRSIHASGVKNTSITTELLNNKISAITFPVDVYAGISRSIRHEWEDRGDTIMFLEGKHKFALDASGKVKTYVGLLSADVWQSQRIISKYTYDSHGFLVQVNVIKEDGTPFRNVFLSWSNGNLIAMRIDYLLGGARDEWVFDYYIDKTVSSFPFVFADIPEMFFFQTGLNFGHSVKNAFKSMRLNSYGNNGRMMSDLTWEFERYIIDANGYIQQVAIHRTDWWDNITNYTFTYNCY